MVGIKVWVSPLDHEIGDDGLDRERIRLEVEKRLLHASLPVNQLFDGKTPPKYPCLVVIVHVCQPQGASSVPIFNIEMFFLQRITLVGPPATDTLHLAWAYEITGDISRTALGFNWSNLYKALEFLADRFIVEYFPAQAFSFLKTEGQNLN